MTDKLLDVPTVATLMSVSKITVRRLLAAGKLPHLRIKNAVRVRESALAAYLKSVEVG
jgi:excisionase family DNA binding protein